MKAIHVSILVLIVVLLAGASVASAQSRSVGQVIDDASITTEIKAKLTADALSNLTKIGVITRNGLVTLTGDVDSLERKARAVQLAGAVRGVRGVVDNIQVGGAPAVSAVTPPPPVPDPPDVDVTGVVSQVDLSTGTIILQDGRVLRVTGDTRVWQPTSLHALRPGTQVLVRSAAPVAVQSQMIGPWRMATVQAVDRASSRLVLTDGTVVRVPPSATIRRGAERLSFDHIVPGAEIVIHPAAPSATGSAEGSALPGTRAVTVAAEINVVWMPAGVRG